MVSEKLFRLLSWSKYAQHFARFKSDSSQGRAVGKLFFKPQIQEVLKKLTNFQLEEAFVTRKDGERLKPPEYKFLTDSELESHMSEAKRKAENWMQMPPVLDAHIDERKVIVEDAALDGHDSDNASLVFTDITYGIPEEERYIVVREPDGALQYATWEQRQRCSEIYFPRPGREIVVPPMFFGEHLEALLENREYKFILDRACAQFEPNDPEYVRVSTSVYLRVAKENHFELLRGTRHYGSLLFYLVFEKEIDTLLLDNLKKLRLQDAISLVHLFHMVHPDSTTAKNSIGLEGESLLKLFISQESVRRSVLELALQSCLENLRDNATPPQQEEARSA